MNLLRDVKPVRCIAHLAERGYVYNVLMDLDLMIIMTVHYWMDMAGATL